MVEQDIEQKTAILKLINSLLIAFKEDDDLSTQLNCDLSLQLFDERYEEALNLVDSAIDDFNSAKSKPALKPVPQSTETTAYIHFEDVYKNQDVTPCNMHPTIFNEETLCYGVYQAEETKFACENPSFLSPLRSNPMNKPGTNRKNTAASGGTVERNNLFSAKSVTAGTAGQQTWQQTPLYPPKSAGSGGGTIDEGDVNLCLSEYETIVVNCKSKLITVCPQNGTMVNLKSIM